MTRRRTMLIAPAGLLLAIALVALTLPAGVARAEGVLLLQLQGRLRSVLQEEPGSLQVPGPAAALPGELHQEQALTRPPTPPSHFFVYVFRKAIRSLRSCGSLRPANAIFVPCMKVSGFSRYLNSTSSVHTRPLAPAALLASE